VGDEVAVGEPSPRRVERVVHGPERVLGGRRLRRLGGVTGVGVHRLEREVAEDEAQLVAEPRLRSEGKLRPEVQRLIQRDLDLEEARLST